MKISMRDPNVKLYYHSNFVMPLENLWCPLRLQIYYHLITDHDDTASFRTGTEWDRTTQQYSGSKNPINEVCHKRFSFIILILLALYCFSISFFSFSSLSIPFSTTPFLWVEFCHHPLTPKMCWSLT